MIIENIPISDIKPYERNAKKHPVEQVEHIANSIREFGFKQPLVVDKDNVLVIGHGRLLAAQVLGLDTVPCVRADDLTPEQIKALRLADNKTNESAWDFDLLDTELEELQGLFDMTDFGFEIQAPFADELEGVVEDDVPEQAEPRCKTGDIWQLGEHRLMCGDSTDAESVAKLMDGQKADMVLTDPPYNVAVGDKNQHLNAFDKGGRHTENISNDKWATDEECGELLWKPAFAICEKTPKSSVQFTASCRKAART